MMFDERAYDAGGTFGTQGQFTAAPVLEGVHFFFHDIGGFAEGTLEKIQRFKGRGAYFMKSKLFKDNERLGFQFLELRSLSSDYVMGASNGLVVNAHDRIIRNADMVFIPAESRI